MHKIQSYEYRGYDKNNPHGGNKTVPSAIFTQPKQNTQREKESDGKICERKVSVMEGGETRKAKKTKKAKDRRFFFVKQSERERDCRVGIENSKLTCRVIDDNENLRYQSEIDSEEENKETYWQFSYSRHVLKRKGNLGFNPVLSQCLNASGESHPNSLNGFTII